MSDVNPSRPRQYRGKLPAPDKHGNVRPRIGGHRFTVGNIRDTSQGEMKRRTNALKDLFDAQCKSEGIDYWANWCLQWAKRIEKGDKLVFNVSPMAKTEDAMGRGFAVEDAEVLSRIKKLGLDIAADDTDAIARGERELRRWLDNRITKRVTELIDEERERSTQGFDDSLADQMHGVAPADPAKAETRTYHEALQAFRSHLRQNGKKREGGKLARSPQNYIRWTKQLEGRHQDFPLWKLDSVKLDELFAFWRNRPVSERTGNHISFDDSRHKLACLKAVVKWLDANSRWSWELPKNYNFDTTPVALDSDRRKNQTRRVTTNTYTSQQLAVIAKQLDTFGKMILGLSVNCGMQPAEIGRLEVGDVYSVHPETQELGPWVIFNRPKTHEYGEWILWPEVAGLTTWACQRAKEVKAELIVVTEKGVPWYRDDWSNPETRFSKWWQAIPTEKDAHEGIVTRLNKTIDGFPRLTIKTLRKILPNHARPKFGAEIADLLNARKTDRHGNIGGGDTDRYSDRLYNEAKQALCELRTEFEPFLAALREDQVVKDALKKTVPIADAESSRR